MLHKALASFRSLKRVSDSGAGRTRTPRRCLPALDCLEDRIALSTASSIVSNFNGTAIPAGDTLWFSSVFKPTGATPTTPYTISVTDSTIAINGKGVNETLGVPNASITFSPTATQATTTFNAATNTWNTTLPASSLSGNAFLDGFGLQVPAGLPGGINSVTWSGNFSSTAAVSLNWQWAASVYTNFSTDNNALGVKPIDANSGSLYNNSDHAGAPEDFKSFVIGGARGGGGSNFTGSYSSTASVTPDVQVSPPPSAPVAPADLSGYVTSQGAGMAGISVTLTGTDNSGNAVNVTVTTNSQGYYDFSGLQPGNYTILQPQYTGGPYVVNATAGTDSTGGDGSANADGSISQIVLVSGDVAINYDFDIRPVNN